MMLVVPHQFQDPAFAAIQNQLSGWGLLFLTAGFSLISIAVLVPPVWVAAAIHLLGSFLLVFLAYGFVTQEVWIGAASYGLMGLGTLIAGLRTLGGPYTRELPLRLDLLDIILGLSAFSIGLITVISANLPARSVSPLLWIPLCVGGLLLVFIQLSLIHYFQKSAIPLILRVLYWIAHLLTGAVFMGYLAWAVIPQAIWPSIVYFGGLGIILWLLPWLSTRLTHDTPTTLQSRIALILAVSTSIPLIMTVALVSGQVENSVEDETLARQENNAIALARSLDDFIRLHRTALLALSQHPNLMDMPLAQQRELLRTYARAYPNATAFNLFDAAGNPISRSDNNLLRSAVGFPIYEIAKITGSPSADILISPQLQKPVFGFGAPVMGPIGDFKGLVTIGILTENVVSFLSNQATSQAQTVYLVDSYGRVISHPNPSLTSSFQDISAWPPVAGMLYSREDWGFLAYRTEGDTILAGYARLKDLGWGIISERTAESAMDGVRVGRDLAFGILLIFLFLTTAGGIALARVLAAPLLSLAYAVNELAAGNPNAPLPSSRVLEIQNLANLFGLLRDRLEQRTAEREQAEKALLLSKQDLENRVEERTQELQEANLQLRYELFERRKAEEQLRESQEQLLVTTEAAELGRWHWDLVRDDLIWNKLCKDLFGLPANQMITYEVFLDLLHPEDRERTDRAIKDALQKQTKFEAEYRAVWSDDSIHWILSVGRGFYAEDDTPLRMIGVSMDITARKKTEEEMRQNASRMEVQHYLTQYREKERLRIAQDLHDGPLQDLIVLNMDLSQAVGQVKEGYLVELLREIQANLQTRIRDLRTFCNELRPPALAPFGLEKAVRSHTDSFTAAHPDLAIQLDLDADGQTLPEPVRLAFFQIYKEMLTNVVKHAQADQVIVRFRLNNGHAVLEIEDDGRGFTALSDGLELARQGHLGLVGAVERAESVGGIFEIISTESQGTRARVLVPWKSTQPESQAELQETDPSLPDG